MQRQSAAEGCLSLSLELIERFCSFAQSRAEKSSSMGEKQLSYDAEDPINAQETVCKLMNQ